MGKAKISEAKAIKFVQAYIDCGFNATEAARQCCRIGSKRGRDPQRTAESLGSRMLRDVEVRRVLGEQLQKQQADKAFVLEQLIHFAKSATKERDRIRATELLGKTMAMFKEKTYVDMTLAESIESIESRSNPVDWDNPPIFSGTPTGEPE